MKIRFLYLFIFFTFQFIFFTTYIAHAQQAKKLIGKKWKYDLLAIIKDMDLSITVLDSMTSLAPENEKVILRNLKSGVASMLQFIPTIGSTTFEFKRNGDLFILWEGAQMTKGKWRMEGKMLAMQFGDQVEDIIIINQLTDSKLVATTENDSALKLVSME
jgi:hypothetical protein